MILCNTEIKSFKGLKQHESEDKILAEGIPTRMYIFFVKRILLMDTLENLPELDCDASRTARQSIIPGRQSPAFKADMSALFFRFLKSRENVLLAVCLFHSDTCLCSFQFS